MATKRAGKAKTASARASAVRKATSRVRAKTTINFRRSVRGK